jgi:hypothetical protein
LFPRYFDTVGLAWSFDEWTADEGLSTAGPPPRTVELSASASACGCNIVEAVILSLCSLTIGSEAQIIYEVIVNIAGVALTPDVFNGCWVSVSRQYRETVL